MKKILLLNLPLVSMPLDALAHLGHAAGAGFAFTGGQLLSTASVALAALAIVAARRLRRRRAARADG